MVKCNTKEKFLYSKVSDDSSVSESKEKFKASAPIKTEISKEFEETISKEFELLYNNRFKQDTELSKDFFYFAKEITGWWILILFIVLLWQLFLPFEGYGQRLSDIQFSVLFSTTTVTVLGFWGIVGLYLFPKKGK